MNPIIPQLYFLFIGSNSSIFESKIGLGNPVDRKFNLPYTGYLLLRKGNMKIATITFINERNCITSRMWGIAVKNNMNDYLAQTPARPKENCYNIFSVLVPEESEFVAALYAIIKVSYKI